LVDRVDERQDAVTTVDELVAMTLAYSRRAQRRIKQLAGPIPEFGFNWIRAAG
jgi:hypothetical protein